MAKFTAPVPLTIRLPGGFEIEGAPGVEHRIPDSLVDEFIRDFVPVIPGGVAWISQDETSVISGEEWFDVTAYGAVGDGVTDDTAAINTAWAAKVGLGPLFFPAGNYLYNGTGLAGSDVNITGAGAGGATIITVGASSRFVNLTAAVSTLRVSGIRFIGGVDVIRSTFTSVNVARYAVVEDCYFEGYTGAAISTNASDWPYWKINRCYFEGANYTTSMGVALSGLTDSSTISDCSFTKNRVHVKARQGGNNLHLTGCDFIRFGATGGSPRVDIWVVPHTSNVGAGSGLDVSACKFGNENLDTADYRLLYADEAAGADISVSYPSLGADSTGYVVGHAVHDSAFYGASAAPVPLVYSTTPNVLGARYGPLTIDAPEAITYALAFRTVPGPDRNNGDNLFGPFLGSNMASENVPAFPISNGLGVGRLVDPTAVLATRVGTVLPYPAGDPAGYVSLLSTLIGSFTAAGGASVAADTDAYGGTDAADLTLVNGGIVFAALAGIVAGRPSWVEFDIKGGSASTLTRVHAYLRYTSNGAFHWARVVEVPAAASGWFRYRFPVVFRAAASTVEATFALPFGDTTTGKVRVGRVRVYHGREPINVDGQMVKVTIGTRTITAGAGTPEGAVSAEVGSLFLRTDGGVSTSLYVKTSGSGNTGWTAK